MATVFTIERDMISKIFSVATLRNRSIGQCNSIIKIMLAGIELEKTAEETAQLSVFRFLRDLPGHLEKEIRPT